HCLHGEIAGRLDDDRPLTTDPGDNRRSIFVVMSPARFALLAPPPRSATQVSFAPLLGLALLASGVIEVIRFHCTCYLAVGFIGEGCIAQPPAPAIARTTMHPQLSRNTSRRTGETEQKRRQNPGRQRPLALVQQRISQVIESALAAVAPIAFAP